MPPRSASPRREACEVCDGSGRVEAMRVQALAGRASRLVHEHCAACGGTGAAAPEHAPPEAAD
jgi:DnaJ-class molecular chaperone